jgi:hypothetical protein
MSEPSRTPLGTGVTTIAGTAIGIAATEPALLGSVSTLLGLAGVNLLGARAIWRVKIPCHRFFL